MAPGTDSVGSWKLSAPPCRGTGTNNNPSRIYGYRVIVEHALLPVRAGMSDEFRSAFSEAKAIISRMPGFASLTLSRCVERPDVFLLLVEWDRLEDHTIGFRGSSEYRQWRELLHRFYEPFPVVEHFEPIEHV